MIITVDLSKKKLSFSPEKIALGEKVEITLNGLESIRDGIRLRVEHACKTIALCDEYVDGVFNLNLNTVQAMKIKGYADCKFILDNVSEGVLYGVGCKELMPWRKEEGGDIPYDLGSYPDVIKAFDKKLNDSISSHEKTIEEFKDSVTEGFDSFKGQQQKQYEEFTNKTNEALSAKAGTSDLFEEAKQRQESDKGLGKRISDLDNKVNSNKTAAENKASELQSNINKTKTELNDRITLVASDVEVIKEQLPTELNKLTTIIGKDENKSARAIASEEVGKLIDGAPEILDTFKEVADYIASDKTGAAAMAESIADNKTAISANETAISEEAARAKAEEKKISTAIVKAQQTANEAKGGLDGKADKSELEATNKKVAALESSSGGGATAPQFLKMNVVPLGSEMLEFSYDGEIESGARLYVEPFKQFDKEVGEWSKEGIVSVGTALCPSVRETFWGDDRDVQINIRTPGTPADGFIPNILWTDTFNVVNTILEENTGQTEYFVALKIELVQDVVEGPNLEPLYSNVMNLNVVDVEHDSLVYTSSIPITDDLLLNGFSYDDDFNILGDRVLEGTGAWLYDGVNVMVSMYTDRPGIDSKNYLYISADAQIVGIINWGSEKFIRLRLEKAEALDGETERYKALHEAYNPTKGVLEYVDMGTTVVLKDEEWTLTANTQDWMLEPSSFSIGGVLNLNFTHSIVFNGSWTMYQSIEEYDSETNELFPYAEYWYGQGIECRSTVMVNNEKYSSTSDEVQLEWNDVTTRPVVNIARQWVDLRVPCVKNGVTDCTICINAPWDRDEGYAMLYLNIIPDQSDYLCITDDYDDHDYIEMPVVNSINRTVLEIKEVEPKVLSIVRRLKD